MSDARPSSVARTGPSFWSRVQKPVVFVLCLGPLFWLAGRGLLGQLGANPIETVIRYLGDWALRFLLIALAVTPLRLVTGWSGVGRFRRMLGLYAFTYVVLHMLAYVGLDQLFDLAAIVREVIKRVYITIGMAALLMLLPLAITSTDKMIKRVGARNWRRLHRLAYVAGVAGSIHYIMMVKASLVQPGIYAAILTVLLGIRVIHAWRRS